MAAMAATRLSYEQISSAAVCALHSEQGAVLLELGEYHARPLISLLENRLALADAVRGRTSFLTLLGEYFRAGMLKWRIRLFHSRLIPIIDHIARTNGSPGWEQDGDGKYVFGILQIEDATL
jgi:hypothetical protein